jgi:uncharacterized protein YcbK (DUF882 family)
MYMRYISALMGLLVAAFAASGAAEARVEKGDGIGARYAGSLTKSKKISKNFRASSKRYRAAKSGKRYRSAKAYKKRGRSMASRSFTRGYDDSRFTSRSCLTSEARGLLARIESNFGPVQIVSTCRPGAVIAGSGKPSKHRYGQAIDFNAGGRKGAIVNWLIRNHHSGGTMTYAGMNHIHVDIGSRFVKLNHGGRRA